MSGATVYEDENFKVILDRFPSRTGHILILPKQHVGNIFEIEPSLAGKLFELAVKVAKAMKETMGFFDLNILQNNGPIAGQSVNHFHLHLIPRYENDGIKIHWTPIEPTDEEIEQMRIKISSKLTCI